MCKRERVRECVFVCVSLHIILKMKACLQGLGDIMIRHKTRLEKEKEAFAAKKSTGGVVADRPVPGYRKATASFKVISLSLSIIDT